ncbi:hypothetical protein F4780DRAFT_773439 [Xylariomycetidae sp. FL0641]|nr:hypothetical protein F4780DRAFT_773439 [Xylariomycetidae sp. FL0641]
MARSSALIVLASLAALSTQSPASLRHATAVTRRAANETYDFVIVGGGPSGFTLADRLTEDPAVTVLVIEAGPFDKGEDGILVPGSWEPWKYLWPDLESVPQPALANRTFGGICGRVVGGGSTLNAMVFDRGLKEDYAAWATLGNEGWDWDGLLPYFKKSEDFTAPDPEYAKVANITYNDEVHGHDGPVQGSYPPYHFPGSSYWWDAAIASGIEVIGDPNSGEGVGLYTMPSLLDPRTMTRSYARTAHFDRVREARPNYHLMAETTASKVLLDGTQAVGVEFLTRRNGTARVRAAKEVILSAGAFHTPQLLQLSGIGPEKLLRRYNITTVVDLPGVGQNLQDHASIEVSYNFTHPLTPNADTPSTNDTWRAEQEALYSASHVGALTVTRGLGTNIASVSIQSATGGFAALPADVDAGVLAGYAIQLHLLNERLEGGAKVGHVHWTTGAGTRNYLTRPYSRGAVEVQSADARRGPRIDWRLMSNPVDLDMAVALVLKLRDVMGQPPMQGLGPREMPPFGEELFQDVDLKPVLERTVGVASAHQCCTAAMLPRDLGGVLDSAMRVHGVQGLRVVDTSAWPMIISAAPTATVYAVAEKIADMIKADYNLTSRLE